MNRVYIWDNLFLSLVGLFLIIMISAACTADETGVPQPEETPSTAALDPQPPVADQPWSESELSMLRSLWLGSLPPLAPDPSNAVADDPRAAAFGQHLFFDNRLSANGQFSCAHCHQPDRFFTDGLPLAQAMGTTLRSTPTIIGVAHSPWFFWDGRRDSQWSQATGPIEAEPEQGATRTQVIHVITQDEAYQAIYEDLFGPLPDVSDPTRFPASAGPVGDIEARKAWKAMQPADQEAVNRVYANLGKAIAAYERLIMPGPARFDEYAAAILSGDDALAETTLTSEEVAGLRLFLGPANCTQCHNGPLFTNHHFHNINLPTGEGLPLDYGRIDGIPQVEANEFNCLSPYSDADPAQCVELRFIRKEGVELPGAFKVPTLRILSRPHLTCTPVNLPPWMRC